MSEKLMAEDLLKTFQITQLTTLFTQSLVHHNITALYAVSDELKRRGKSEIIHELVGYAFKDGCEFRYNSAIAEALKLILEDIRKVDPMNMMLWDFLRSNEGSRDLMTMNEYQTLLEKNVNSYFDMFCDSMTPAELAHISVKTLNVLVTHYIDPDEDLGIEVKNKQEEDSIRWYKAAERLAILLKPQIKSIATDASLFNAMIPKICYILKVDQLREEFLGYGQKEDEKQ